MAVSFRECKDTDVPKLARIRASEWGDTQYWETRISGYLNGVLSPQKALAARVCYVAVDEQRVVGFVAGHLTRRYACEGEIQWINVAPDWRRKSVASELLRLVAKWFIAQGAFRICVDVEPSNTAARALYGRLGATDLKAHWLVWDDIRSLFGAAER